MCSLARWESERDLIRSEIESIVANCQYILMPAPLHVVISEKLRQQIVSGKYQPGEQLPSEHQLMATFGMSRITVRRAIANLVNQGLVSAHQGKGVFVAERRKVTYALSSPLVFVEQDLARQGIKFAIQNLVFKKVLVPEPIQIVLQLPSNDPIAYLQKKIFLMDDVPGAVDVTYILPHLGKAFAKDLKRSMTFPLLEQRGIAIAHIEAILECTHTDYEISTYLEVPLGHPLIVYRYTAYTTDNQPIVHGETISRADRFCYSVTIRKGAE
jgi:GntR family transcriptional regulator